MTLPIRVQLSRKKGWKMPIGTVSVARPAPWGNPWKVGLDGNVTHCVDEFRRLLTGEPVKAWPLDPKQAPLAMRFGDVDYMRQILRGKNLACWCALSHMCHADVLLELANSNDKKISACSDN